MANAAPNQIKIVGQGDKLFDYDKVKASVVKIGAFYYSRTDESLVWITNSEGKLRAFRKESPLICPTDTGEYILKSDAVMTDDGVWLAKKSGTVVYVDNKPCRKVFCKEVNGKWYLKTDPRLMTCKYTGELLLKEDAITLSTVYCKGALASPNLDTITTHDGQLVPAAHVTRVYDPISNDQLIMHTNEHNAKRPWANVVIGFQDKTNPQEGRLVHMNIRQSYVPDHVIEYRFNEHTDVFPIPRNLKPYFDDMNERYIAPRYQDELTKIRDKMNKNFSDLDEKENVAKKFHIIKNPFPGKQRIYTSSAAGTPIIGTKFTMTGGLQYSYGVELETSNGLLANDLIDALALSAVGDRSVGAGEYVTAPIMGNEGMLYLRKVCEALNKHTLVDDRCGLHVHVGTLMPKAKQAPINAPTFNKEFLINSIRLGCYIEEELYKAMPPNRETTLYHCHSIQRWRDISKDNFDTYFGAYIFGRKENWKKPTDTSPHVLFDFKDFKLGPSRNHEAEVGPWADGRYKWLNLIPSYLRGNHKTIEFRIFAGTTVYEKVSAAVLTALAFTYVADNCSQIIKPGITLSDMFSAAFKGHKTLIASLNEFYAERTARFNRKSVYPKLDLPFLKELSK